MRYNIHGVGTLCGTYLQLDVKKYLRKGTQKNNMKQTTIYNYGILSGMIVYLVYINYDTVLDVLILTGKMLEHYHH